MGARRVGVRAQPALQAVLARLAQDRVRRIGGDAALFVPQRLRKLDHGIVASQREPGKEAMN